MEVRSGLVEGLEVDVALKQLAADLDVLLGSDLAPVTAREATERTRLVEAVRTRSEALTVRLTEAVDASGVFADSGLRSGQTFCAHAAKLSPTTARRRGQLTRATWSRPPTPTAPATPTNAPTNAATP